MTLSVDGLNHPAQGRCGAQAAQNGFRAANAIHVAFDDLAQSGGNARLIVDDGAQLLFHALRPWPGEQLPDYRQRHQPEWQEHVLAYEWRIGENNAHDAAAQQTGQPNGNSTAERISDAVKSANR